MTTCQNYTCGNVTVQGGAILPWASVRASDCPYCWTAAKLGIGRQALPIAASKPAKSRQVSTTRKTSLPLLPPCKWEGPITSSCATCGDKERRHERQCGHPDGERDTCTRGNERSTLQRCNACPQYEREVVTNGRGQSANHRGATSNDSRGVHNVPATRIDALPPTRRIPVNLPGHFNAGLILHAGRLLLATRHAERIYVSELDGDYQPVWSQRIALVHPLCSAGQEDPRLFLHRGKLHVGFAGISHVNGGKKLRDLRITQLVAELDDEFRTVKIIAPTFPGVKNVEKNWGWFSRDEVLHCVYSISPHVVIAFPGSGYQVKEMPNDLPWSGGYLRGGAPPFLRDDRYVCWFHGAEETREGRIYNVGVYKFSAKTFEITAQSPHPLLWADPSTKPANSPAHAVGVVFPAGAVLRDDEWLISCGIHDVSTEVMVWPREVIA